MRCYACGQPNNAHARFCNGCGASLTNTAWPQPAPAEAAFSSNAYAPVETAYAPTPYTPPQPLAQGFVAVPDAGQYPGAVPGGGYAPFAVPAAAAAPPMAGPSLVNTVTVNQVAPSPPPPAPMPTVIADHHVGGLTVALSALFFVATGIGAGLMWFAASQAYNNGDPLIVVAVVTVLLFLLDMLIVARLARK